jgi:ABC-type bacteriocin/lantibiotic exporter with double-glycine peptidase domain
MATRLPPPRRQGKGDNCALACLRSILAYHGTDVDEATLENRANKRQWGVEIEDLRAAAESFGLRAQIRKLDLAAIADCISRNIFPIAYLNRFHLDRRFPVRRALALRSLIPHAVVPVRVSPKFVLYSDPLTGKRHRASHRKFEAARADLSMWCLVCESQAPHES